MNIFITGHRGFIGRNLVNFFQDHRCDIASDKMSVSYEEPNVRSYKNLQGKYTGELDITMGHQLLAEVFSKRAVNFVIHNAAIVGTDVCALYPEQTRMSNIIGTYNVAKACELLDIPVLYIGTTVIYDTAKYQNEKITEKSDINPRTFYAQTKYDGELILRNSSVDCKIIRPLFCYGGEGDMNSLIAKTIYNHYYSRKKFKIYLDQFKVKSYMHVEDFCYQIALLIDNWKIATDEEFNAANTESMDTGDIVRLMLEQGIDTSFIQWVPEVDYLGNHLVDSSRLQKTTGYSSYVSLKNGIERVKNDLKKMDQKDYNPLVYLEEVEKRNQDILSAYPKV